MNIWESPSKYLLSTTQQGLKKYQYFPNIDMKGEKL